MKRTTIMLPSDLKRKALRRANHMGISLAELIRNSLESLLNHSQEQASDDPLFADDIVFNDQGPKNFAKNHDHYLYRNKQ